MVRARLGRSPHPTLHSDHINLDLELRNATAELKMRFSASLSLTLSLFAASAQAQYFTEGWQPGNPVQLPIKNDNSIPEEQETKQPASGWIPSQQPPSPPPPTPQDQQTNTDDNPLSALWSRLTSKTAQENTTFNTEIVSLTHTPHLAPLWGPELTAEELSARGPTIEDQLGIPRSSVVSAARRVKVAEGAAAPWARARSSGSAPEGKSSSKGSALSFEPWIVLVSSKTDDATSVRFNIVFNDTVNLISPPPAGQEAVPPTPDSLATMPDEETEEDREVVDDVMLRYSDALKRLRFAHADYLTQPAVSWHWWIWKVPIVLFITPSTSPERAYDIRFWRIASNPPSKARFLSIICDENKWKQLPIWTSSMAPGSERDYIPERITKMFTYIYVVLEKVPGPVLPIAAAMLAQPLLQLMHRRSGMRS
ncbi:hypothetical protein CF326_g278 [Tilletia indica]|nr:hypothetical protein CF326_g278 [Tilletia indica]